MLVSFIFSRGLTRGAVLFNASNELGYFAVLSASIIVLSIAMITATGKGSDMPRMYSVGLVAGPTVGTRVMYAPGAT